MHEVFFQEVKAKANQLVKDVEDIGELTASGAEFTKLVKRVRDLAYLVEAIASQLQQFVSATRRRK